MILTIIALIAAVFGFLFNLFVRRKFEVAFLWFLLILENVADLLPYLGGV